jgi:hypothetical protein
MITAEKESMETITIENVSRRHFLQGVLGASAFVLCVTKSPFLAKAAGSATPKVLSIDGTVFHPGVYVGIQSDGTVLIV